MPGRLEVVAPRPLPWRLAGLLAAIGGLAAGQLTAAVTGPDSSPYFAVSGVVVDLTPRPVKDTVILMFGPADKLILLGGLALTLAVSAAAVGQIAARATKMAVTAVICFGAVGAIAAFTRPDAGPGSVLPSLVATTVAATVLWKLSRRLHEVESTESSREPVRSVPGGQSRRQLLTTGGVILAGSVAAVALARWLTVDRYGAARSRAAVRIPTPVNSAPPAPPHPGVRRVSPFHTPNRGFYRVDTALRVPQVTAEEWELRIHGMVGSPLRLTYPQLLSRPMIERDITLACVSNPVGGRYVGNARWIGVPVADLLREARVDPGADQTVSRSRDGMTIGTPTVALLDGRDALLAVAMNGEPLPLEHGFPVRMVVPGLYGYISACKWLVELELTTFARYDAYWVRQGWAAQAQVKTASRIDTPRDGARVHAGTVIVGGVAWAQHRGIMRVELQVDEGGWYPADLVAVPSVDTWRQWTLPWQATPGEHRLRVRATDGRGDRQTGTQQDPFPDGATGWHEVTVTVVE